jgi:hypothetical protein
LNKAIAKRHGSGYLIFNVINPIRPHLQLQSDLSNIPHKMSGHHHDHSGGCHGEDHDHSNDITPAIQSLLYSQIDFDKIITLNGKSGQVSTIQARKILIADATETIPKAGAAIVQKTWAERLNDKPELESDADEQLLMTIP